MCCITESADLLLSCILAVTGFSVGSSKNFFLLGMYVISRYSASHFLNRSQTFNTLSFVTFLSSLPSVSYIMVSFTAESSNHVNCIAGTSSKLPKIPVLGLNSFLYRSRCWDSRHSIYFIYLASLCQESYTFLIKTASGCQGLLRKGYG